MVEEKKGLEERMGDFEEEVKKIGKKVNEKVKENMDEKRSRLKRTLGVLYPLLTSLIGLIILGISIVSIEVLNLALETSFLFTLHAFLVNNLEILFLALLVTSYGSYLEKKFRDLHLVLSPLITSFGVTVFLWVLASVVGMLNMSLGRYHSIGISNMVLSNLGNIFVVLAIIGYVVLMVKKDKKLSEEVKDTSSKATGKQESGEGEIKRLYRSGKDNLLGGVCGGIAEYLKTDPVLIRLLWVAMILLSLGFGILFYIIAWIIIPRNPEHEWRE